MKIIDQSLFQLARSLTLALVLLSFALAGCAFREARVQEAGGSSRQAATLLAKARRTPDTRARIGLVLAAADNASQAIAEGEAEHARTLYNSACAELAVLVEKSSSAPTLPATLSTPAGPYVLKFDSSPSRGRWNPDYFTELLMPSELKSKSFVSKNPPAGYGGVLVGVYRPPNPRKMLLPWIGVSAPVTAVLNFSKPAQSGQPVQATLTLFNPAEQSSARIAGKTARSPLI